jgi:amino acid transporter
MNAAILLNFTALGLALLVLWRTEPALARMGPTTHWMIRYAILLLAAGALAIIMTVAAGASVDFTTLILLAGITLLLICERRLRHRINQPGDRHA